jgi:hypothetical protein
MGAWTRTRPSSVSTWIPAEGDSDPPADRPDESATPPSGCACDTAGRSGAILLLLIPWLRVLRARGRAFGAR